MSARLPIALLAASSALALSACKIDSRPLLARNGPPQSAAYDPGYNGLPAPGPLDPAYYSYQGAPAQIGQPGPLYDGYALAERARLFDRAVYRAPPTYGFRYQDEQPWFWQAANDYMFAEPYNDGYRFYYYDDPASPYPYFVRDPWYGYGYGPDGELLAAYDASGALLPPDQMTQIAYAAGRYLLQSRSLRDYAFNDRYRVAVPYDAWNQRAPYLYRAQDAWITAPERQPQWRAWRDGHQDEIARLAPSLAALEGRRDNGLHLGWLRGRGNGGAGGGGDPRAMAVTAPREFRQGQGPRMGPGERPRGSGQLANAQQPRWNGGGGRQGGGPQNAAGGHGGGGSKAAANAGGGGNHAKNGGGALHQNGGGGKAQGGGPQNAGGHGGGGAKAAANAGGGGGRGGGNHAKNGGGGGLHQSGGGGGQGQGGGPQNAGGGGHGGGGWKAAANAGAGPGHGGGGKGQGGGGAHAGGGGGGGGGNANAKNGGGEGGGAAPHQKGGGGQGQGGNGKGHGKP